MLEGIVQKIEKIRQKPEHVRLQYALGSVIICMLFVIGVWILTLKQGFLDMSSELGSGKDEAKESIENVREVFPSTDSLRQLKENSEPLQLKSTDADAEKFLESEQERRPVNQTTPNQELP